jgi:hypothetical protein
MGVSLVYLPQEVPLTRLLSPTSSSFFFFAVLGLELKAYTLSHLTNPFLCWVFFRDRSHELFACGWLRTAILLISTS